MKRYWKPIPIEEYFKDDPELLLMWEALEIVEEKRVPFYADEPIARSEKVDMKGVFRTNFNPRKKLYQLHLVADAIGVDTLPVDMDKAFEKIVKYLEDAAIRP